MDGLSEDGYFTLRGRKRDLIISVGFNIYPREIEEFLLEQAGVSEVVYVGVPHETRGVMPKASIVPAENFNAVLIEELFKKTFASFKIPRRFIAVESLPRTALGKVQKHLLPKPEFFYSLLFSFNIHWIVNGNKFAFAFRYHNSGNSISNKIGNGSGFTHEFINA